MASTAGADLLSRAFDPGAATPPDDASSERILDAALELAAASGIRNLTMDEVAVRAGLGRMTVYRRFGSKDRLLDALAVREGRRCLATVVEAMDFDAPVDEQVADGFLAGLRLAREHPLIDRLVRHEPESLLRTINADGGFLFSMVRAVVAERIRDAIRRGMLSKDLDPDEAAESFFRLCLSFVLIPETVVPLDDERAARAYAHRMIAPLLSG